MFFKDDLTTNSAPANQPSGKFIVIYGINNLGKTTQAKMLVAKLRQEGLAAEYIKYPIYDLAPSGTLINDYLRQGNFHKLTPREAQIIYTLNRTQYETALRQKLAQGIYIVAEDYIGTGLAWGIGTGVDEQFLKFINSHLAKEDLAILLDGYRFSEGVETNHRHEQNETLTDTVRLIHLRLAEERNWQIINANQTIEQVHKAIWERVKKIIPSADDSYDLEAMIKEAYPQASADKLPPAFNATTVINPLASPNKNSGANPRLLQPEEKIPEPTLNFYPELVIPIQKLTPEAKLPTRAHSDDAGFDLYANDNYTLYEQEIVAVGTGIAAAIPDGYAGLIWDKSGLASQGLKTAGGVIDSTYRGEIKVVVINLSGDILHIAQGQKIAQILIQKIETPTICEVGELKRTQRDDGGFGSSGAF